MSDRGGDPHASFQEIHNRVHVSKSGDDEMTILARKLHKWFLCSRVCGSEENLGDRWLVEIKELAEILRRELKKS